MARFKLLLSEAVRSLFANVSTTAAATMTVLIGMFLLGFLIGLSTWAFSLSNHYKRELVVTHNREMVDKMRRRVIALDEGRLVRDEAAATYHDESTKEFAARMRAEMGVGDEGGANGHSDEPFEDA